MREKELYEKLKNMSSFFAFNEALSQAEKVGRMKADIENTDLEELEKEETLLIYMSFFFYQIFEGRKNPVPLTDTEILL